MATLSDQNPLKRTKEYISEKHAETVNDALFNHRNELKNLSKALRARRGSKQKEYFKHADFRHILKVFPIWLVKMNDINKVLPLYYEHEKGSKSFYINILGYSKSVVSGPASVSFVGSGLHDEFVGSVIRYDIPCVIVNGLTRSILPVNSASPGWSEP